MTKTEQSTEFVEQCLVRPERLGYLAWHEKAEQLTKRKIQQTHCRHCQRWRFPNEHMSDDRCAHSEASEPQPRER